MSLGTNFAYSANIHGVDAKREVSVNAYGLTAEERAQFVAATTGEISTIRESRNKELLEFFRAELAVTVTRASKTKNHDQGELNEIRRGQRWRRRAS